MEIKKYLLFLTLVATFCLNAQEIHYGYPDKLSSLDKGDILIINLPDNLSGKFVDITDFDRLISIIELSPDLFLNINIYIFLSNEKVNNRYSLSLSESMKRIFSEKEVKQENYKIFSCGSNQTILCKDAFDDKKYFNSRIEIVVD